MKNISLDDSIKKLGIDNLILNLLNENNILSINDLWNLKRKDLKLLKLSNNQINQIIVKLQLKGLDLNKKIYN